MANGYGAGGQVASYPSSGYPYSNFAGAGIPGRSGVPMGSSGGSVASVGPARGHKIIGFLIIVVVAYALWHISSKV